MKAVSNAPMGARKKEVPEMRKKRGPFALVAVVALALCCLVSGVAYAHEVPDASQPGSITVSMTYEDEAVAGGTLTLYRVGVVAEDDGNYSFALADEFAGSGVSLDHLDAAGLAESLAEYAASAGVGGASYAVGSDGVMSITGLELGLYLVVQTEAADGFEAVAPFLVSVPMYDEATGAYVYDVDATPKMETLTESPVEPEEPVEEVTETPASTTGTTSSTLPSTGTPSWIVPILAAAGVGILLVGATLALGRRARAA